MQRLPQTFIPAALLAIAAAPNVWAQNAPACQSVEFSPFVLERAPSIREACLDVIERGGEQFAVIKTDLIGATRNSVRVRFKRPDGSEVESRTITVRPGFRVLVDGKPTRIEDLAIGQELTAYVKVTEPVVTLEPGTEEQPLEPAPVAQQPEPVVASTAEPALPQTASVLPALAVGGLLLMLIGCMLTVDRFMYARRASSSDRTKEYRHG